MQTVFRPELQEDKYYARYLQDKIKSKIEKSKDGLLDKDTLRENIEMVISNLNNNQIPTTVERLIKHLKISYEPSKIKTEISEMISEGYLQADNDKLTSDSLILIV